MSIQAPSHRTVPSARADGIPWVELSGIRLGVVLWGGLAVIDVARVAGVPSYGVLGALTVLVAMSSVGMRTRTALAAAGIGWLLVDGFVVHRYGVLGFDGNPDVARLALLVGVATAATRVRR